MNKSAVFLGQSNKDSFDGRLTERVFFNVGIFTQPVLECLKDNSQGWNVILRYFQFDIVAQLFNNFNAREQLVSGEFKDLLAIEASICFESNLKNVTGTEFIFEVLNGAKT